MKNSLHKSLIIILLFTFLAQIICAQDYKIQQLKFEQVLDNQSILTIDQDNDGRLWFGGQNNLFVYDSRTVENIMERGPARMSNYYIIKIAVDRNNNNLLIGTGAGLLIYDIEKDEFLSYKVQTIKEKIWDIKIADGKLFCGTEHGFYELTFDTTKKEYLIHKKHFSEKTQTIEVANSEMFFSSQNNIYHLGADQNARLYKSLPIMDDYITVIKKIGSYFWIGTHKSGIYILNNSHISEVITEMNSNLLSNNVRKIIPKNEEILVGTLKGLTTISSQRIFGQYAHMPSNPLSISQNSIYDIFSDNQNIIWIGTYFGGMNMIYPNNHLIQTIANKPTSKHKISSEIIGDYEESENHIFIGTEELGVEVIDKKALTSQNIKTPSNLIKSLLIKDNYLYIGQHNGGISRYDLTTKQIDNNFFYKQNSSQNNVNIISPTPNSLIVGTDAGLFEIVGNSITKFQEFSNRGIFNIVSDAKENTYVLLYDGIWKKKFSEKKFTKIDLPNLDYEIDDKEFAYIHFDQEANLLLGDSHTIYKLKNGILHKLYQNNQLKLGSFVFHNNVLWISSNQGLIHYDLIRHKEHILTVEDGLTTNHLTSSKIYISPNNELIVTSLKGINIIPLDHLEFNNLVPHVLVSKFTVMNQRTKLTKTDVGNYNIILPYDQNYFNIEFSSSNFIKPEKNKFKYKLEGFDNEWVMTDEAVAQYMNVSPGKYTLQLLASNNDGVWSDKPTQITIKINPPIWKTWWAYALYVLLALTILHFTIKFIVEREVLINAEKEHQKKINFFTQISHEIRTPLTLIFVPIEEILNLSDGDPKIFPKAKRLHDNAKKLLSLVNELLDFKKLDDGMQTLQLQPINIKQYLEESFYLFSDLAVAKNLNFYIERIASKSKVLIDTKQFDKVLFNLLSNAIKYSHDNGTVKLSVYEKNNQLIIKIIDNGIGIKQENQFKIFEEYYRDPNAQDILGTGIGLALTKKIVEQHNGEITCYTDNFNDEKQTVFKISLPIAASKNSSEQIESINTVQKNEITIDNALPTLLVVEDNRELADTIASIFEGKYKILKAFNGEEGVELATKYLPEIIITDLMMPNMNGIEMTKLLKLNMTTAHIPIVMLTADTNETSRIAGLEFGANVYLEKPFNISVLTYSVKNLLQIAAKNRSNFNIIEPELNSEVDSQFIQKIESIIETNLLNHDFGVDYLAREIGMSQPILYKKLKSITNLSVNNFIKQYRFKKALQLLGQKNNISEVAYAVGFNDRKYFSREFKKHFGLNPSEYMEENKS